jgi:hypothetical protein
MVYIRLGNRFDYKPLVSTFKMIELTKKSNFYSLSRQKYTNKIAYVDFFAM